MADDQELYKKALEEHAIDLGIDPIKDKKYMYIAEEALNAPLPPDWEQGVSDDGTPYHFNTVTGESLWEHPSDEIYIQKFKDAKARDEKVDITKVEEFSDDDEEPFTIKMTETPKTDEKKESSSGVGRDWKSWLIDDGDKSEDSLSDDDNEFSAPPPSLSLPKKTQPISVLDPTKETVSKYASPKAATPEKKAIATKDNPELLKQIETLKSQALDLQKTNATLKSEVEEANRAASEANYLKMKISELKSELKTKASSSSSAFQKQISDIEASKESLAMELQTEKANFKSEKNDLQKSHDALVTKLKAEHEIEVQDLQHILSSSRTSSTNHESTIKELELTIENKKNEIIESQQNLKIKLDLSETALKKSSSENLELKSLLEEVEAENNVVKQKLTSLAKTSKNTIDSLLSEKDRLVSEMEKIKEDAEEELQNSVESTKIKITDLQNELMALKKEISVRESEIAAERLELQSKFNSTEIQRKSLEEREAKHRKDTEKIAASKITLEHALASSNGTASALKQELAETASRNLKTICDLERKASAASLEAARLQQRLEEEQKARRDDAFTLESRREEVQIANEEIGRLRKKLASDESLASLEAERQKRLELEDLLVTKRVEYERNVTSLQSDARKAAEQLSSMTLEIERKLPELAAAASARAGDEWKKRHEGIVRALVQEHEAELEKQRVATISIESSCRKVESDVRSREKALEAEHTYLKRESQRLEENNKVLQEQLAFVRSSSNNNISSSASAQWSTGAARANNTYSIIDNQKSNHHWEMAPPPPLPRSQSVVYSQEMLDPLPPAVPLMAQELDEKVDSTILIKRLEAFNEKKREALEKETMDLFSQMDHLGTRVPGAEYHSDNNSASIWYQANYWKQKYAPSLNKNNRL